MPSNYEALIREEIKDIKRRFSSYSDNRNAFTHWSLKLVAKSVGANVSHTNCTDAFTGGS